MEKPFPISFIELAPERTYAAITTLPQCRTIRSIVWEQVLRAIFLIETFRHANKIKERHFFVFSVEKVGAVKALVTDCPT